MKKIWVCLAILTMVCLASGCEGEDLIHDGVTAKVEDEIQQTLEDAQGTLDEAQNMWENGVQGALEEAQGTLDDAWNEAQGTLEEAQGALDEAQGALDDAWNEAQGMVDGVQSILE